MTRYILLPIGLILLLVTATYLAIDTTKPEQVRQQLDTRPSSLKVINNHDGVSTTNPQTSVNGLNLQPGSTPAPQLKGKIRIAED